MLQKRLFRTNMKQLWLRFKEDLLANIIVFFIVAILSTVGFLLYFFLAGPQNIYGATNASLIAFCIPADILAFYLLARFGTFDTLGYGTSYLVGMFRIHPKKKYKDLVEYRDIKDSKRHKTYYYIPMGLVTIITLLILIIVYIIYKNTFHV